MLCILRSNCSQGDDSFSKTPGAQTILNYHSQNPCQKLGMTAHSELVREHVVQPAQTKCCASGSTPSQKNEGRKQLKKTPSLTIDLYTHTYMPNSILMWPNQHTFTYKHKLSKIYVCIEIQLRKCHVTTINNSNSMTFLPTELIVQIVAWAQNLQCSEAYALQYKGDTEETMTYHPQASCWQLFTEEICNPGESK